MKYRTIETSKLKDFNRRDVRPAVLDKLRERIKDGYNPARPLTVVEVDGDMVVADGNHRLRVLRELGIKEVPCVVRDDNPYKLSVQCNSDEDTYAPEDLFDRLDTIKALSDDHTQGQIGELLGISRSAVRDYNKLTKDVGARFLDLARSHQFGRAPQNGAVATFNFTERWFRDSGLYDLIEVYQLIFMTKFKDDKFNWKKQKVQQLTAMYKLWQEMEEKAKDGLHDVAALEGLVDEIRRGLYKDMKAFNKRMDTLNEEAANRLIKGDCIAELGGLEDASIDIVITDPPYGISYESNRSEYADHITKAGIENDGLEEAVDLFTKAIDVLYDKMKDGSVLFVFTGWQTYSSFEAIVKAKFTMRNMCIWDKGNHGAGDLTHAFGNRHEQIIFAAKGSRPLNKRISDIFTVSKVDSSKLVHPTQKPVELIRQILSATALEKDVFCDPFMGSGSHVKAAKDFGCSYIGIELDKDHFEKAKILIDE